MIETARPTGGPGREQAGDLGRGQRARDPLPDQWKTGRPLGTPIKGGRGSVGPSRRQGGRLGYERGRRQVCEWCPDEWWDQHADACFAPPAPPRRLRAVQARGLPQLGTRSAFWSLRLRRARGCAHRSTTTSRHGPAAGGPPPPNPGPGRRISRPSSRRPECRAAGPGTVWVVTRAGAPSRPSTRGATRSSARRDRRGWPARYVAIAGRRCGSPTSTPAPSPA